MDTAWFYMQKNYIKMNPIYENKKSANLYSWWIQFDLLMLHLLDKYTFVVEIMFFGFSFLCVRRKIHRPIHCFWLNSEIPSQHMCPKQAEFIQSHVNPKFLKDVTASPVKQRRICLISMYELFGYPATWLCNFPTACRCISEQRPDLCKCHFISLAVQA